MRIEKRISFSLDEVWNEWCFRRHGSKAYQHEFASCPVLTSLGSKSGTLFVSESGKTCQHYFGGFQTRDFSRYADRPEIPNQALTALTVVCGVLRALGGTNRCVQRTLVSKV